MSDERRAERPLPAPNIPLLDPPIYSTIGHCFGMGINVVLVTGFTADGLSARWNAPLVIPIDQYEAMCRNGLATIAKMREMNAASQREPGHG